MLVITILSSVILIIILLLFLLAGKKYSDFIEENKADFQLVFMAPASLYVVDKLQLMRRLSSQLVTLQRKISILYGGKTPPQYTKMFVAQLISFMMICLAGGSLFYFFSGNDYTLFIFSLILTGILPVLLIKNLDKKTLKRRHDIIYELPEFANKVALLVNAGETVQDAIIRCTLMKGDDNNPLYVELNNAVAKLRNGEAFSYVLEEFSKKCGVQEVSIFTTTVLLNHRRGGGELSLALRELSGDLWEKRKAISKIRGEEASSKLLFPMMLMFIAILIIMAFPALKQLG